jgi:hypothetical protein
LHRGVVKLYNNLPSLHETDIQTFAMLSALGNPRQAAAQLMNFALILSTAFMVRTCLLELPDES